MLVELIVPFLGKLLDRLLPNPKDKAEAQALLLDLELKAKEAEARMEEARERSFADFIAATQPKSEHIHLWAATAIALVRPALAVFTAVTVFTNTEKWVWFLETLGKTGIWGAIGLSPLLVWVLGRDGLRLVLGAISTARNGGHIPPEVLPPGLPVTRGASPSAPTPGRPVLPDKPKPPVWPVWRPPHLSPVEGDNRETIR